MAIFQLRRSPLSNLSVLLQKRRFLSGSLKMCKVTALRKKSWCVSWLIEEAALVGTGSPTGKWEQTGGASIVSKIISSKKTPLISRIYKTSKSCFSKNKICLIICYFSFSYLIQINVDHFTERSVGSEKGIPSTNYQRMI